MTVTLDHLDVAGKQHLITGSVVAGGVLSHMTCIGRVLAKYTSMGRLHAEDWFMLGALILSYPMIWAEFYGKSQGLGQHEKDITKAALKQVNISIWVIQRVQPPAIFCIKTSIILLYVRIFQTPKFRKVAWGIWIYTLLWMIGAWTASTFECTPVNYFWDKTIKGGHCVNNALTVIGFTNGFLSFLGDVFILCMPLPMVWKLQMNKQSKIALTCIFLFGLFVVGTSIVRFIALFGIVTTDLTFTQVQPRVWTYLEISIGITCGNLPLLRPLFRRFFDNSTSTQPGSQSKLAYSRSTRSGIRSHIPPQSANGFKRMGNDFESINGSGNGSEVELRDRYVGEGIKVETNVELRVAEVGEDWVVYGDGRDPLVRNGRSDVRVAGRSVGGSI